MTNNTFAPVVYVKQGCPFCLKLRLFLLESRLLDSVTLLEAETPEEHQRLANQLFDHMGKASFPSAEIMPGEYLAESDALINHFAAIASVDPKNLPTFDTYANKVLPSFQNIYRDYIQLKKQLS